MQNILIIRKTAKSLNLLCTTHLTTLFSQSILIKEFLEKKVKLYNIKVQFLNNQIKGFVL